MGNQVNGKKWFNEDGSRMTCTVTEGCEKPIQARGLCANHYKTVRRTTGLFGVPLLCSEQDCQTVSESRGLCQYHYLKMRSDERRVIGELCKEPGCGQGIHAKQLCKAHYGSLRALQGSNRGCPVQGCARSVVDSKTVCRTHRTLASTYSLSVYDIIQMHSGDNYVCGNPGCLSTARLHIDHDHACCDKHPNRGKQSCGACVRGWLCMTCNVGLGSLGDSPERIQGLLAYLERFKK